MKKLLLLTMIAGTVMFGAVLSATSSNSPVISTRPYLHHPQNITEFHEYTVAWEEAPKMQWFSWKATGTVEDTPITDLFISNRWPIFEIDNHRIFFTVVRNGSADGIYYADPIDYTSWTKITALGASSSKAIFHLMASGRIYCWNGVSGNAADPEIYYSDDDGDNWTATDESNLNDYRPFAFFEISGDLFVAAATEPNGRRIDIFKYDDVGDSYTSQANQTMDTTASVTLYQVDFGVADGTDFYYIADYNDGVTYNSEARFWKYDNTGPSISAVSNFQSLGTYKSVSATSGTVLVFPRVFATDDRTYFYTALTKITAGPTATTWLLKSDDSGATWEEVEATEYQFLPDSYFLGNGIKDKRWSYITSLNIFPIRYLDSNIKRNFVQVNSLQNVVDDEDSYVFGMSSTGILFTLADDGRYYTRVYEYQDLSEKITATKIRYWGTERFPDVSFYVQPADIGYFEENDIIELYDDNNVLAIRARVKGPKNTTSGDRSIYWVYAEGVQREVTETYGKEYASGTSQAKGQDAVDTATWLYRDSSITPHTGGSPISWVYKNSKGRDALFNLIRELEKALVYYEPDGKTWMANIASPQSSGLTWSEATSGLYVKNYWANKTNGVTRSEVIGCYNTSGQARKVYVGDAAAEVTNGKVLIQRKDPNLNNHTEVNQLATNRYTLYGGTVRVVELVASGKGFIQPGETITFSWADNRITIASGTFYIMYTEYDIKSDINTIWLVDTILTAEEIDGLKTIRGVDADIQATYYDDTVESSADGTVLKQNPIAAIKGYGTGVWLTPEPSAVHFTQAQLHTLIAAVDTWYDLDLSKQGDGVTALLPKEARIAHLHVTYNDNIRGGYVRVRKKGQANAIQKDELIVLVPNSEDYKNLEVGVDDDLTCQILANPRPTNWITLTITVTWWNP